MFSKFTERKAVSMFALLVTVLVASLFGTSWANTAATVPWWWVVTKIDVRVGSESGSYLSFTGPLSLLEQCNLFLEVSKASLEEKWRRIRESNPTLQFTVSVARCQTGVVITSGTNSPWWIFAIVRTLLQPQYGEVFIYSGPFATHEDCNDGLAGYKQGYSKYPNRLLSASCAPFSITY